MTKLSHPKPRWIAIASHAMVLLALLPFTSRAASPDIDLLLPEPDTTAKSSQQSTWLERHGIKTDLLLQNNWFHGGTLGQNVGKTEHISTLALRLNLDLGKLMNLRNSYFHFEWVDNYGRINNAIGSSIGAFPLAQIPQNAPRFDVPVFTYEKRFPNQGLEIEFGRKNVVWFFIDQYSPWEDFSRPNNSNWMALPPPYATWSARASYELGGGYFTRIGLWEYNSTLFGYNGWDYWTRGASGITFLGTFGQHTTSDQSNYPGHTEVTAYHTQANQEDPYYTVRETSRIFDTESALKTHRGGSGIILSSGRVIYRPINGKRALYTYAGIGTNLQSWAASGVAGDAYIGASWIAPDDPHANIYGIKYEVTQLTTHMQRYLQDSNLKAGGSGYSSGRTTSFIKAYAHLNLGLAVTLDPFIAYGINPNTMFSATATRPARSGFVAGAMLTLNIGRVLGI